MGQKLPKLQGDQRRPPAHRTSVSLVVSNDKVDVLNGMTKPTGKSRRVRKVAWRSDTHPVNRSSEKGIRGLEG